MDHTNRAAPPPPLYLGGEKHPYHPATGTAPSERCKAGPLDHVRPRLPPAAADHRRQDSVSSESSNLSGDSKKPCSAGAHARELEQRGRQGPQGEQHGQRRRQQQQQQQQQQPQQQSHHHAPPTNVYTHCGRHTDQFLFGGRSVGDLVRSLWHH